MAEGNQVDRRLHERLGVVVPVELRIFDLHGGNPVHGPIHGLVTDASASGLRLELVGPAAELFRDDRFDDAPVSVTFLIVSLHKTAVGCDIRWRRTTPEGCALGLQLSGEKQITAHVLAELQKTSMPQIAKRNAIRIALTTAAAVLLVGLGVLTYQSLQAQESLQGQMTQASTELLQARESAADLRRRFDSAQKEIASLRQQLAALQEEDAADDAALPAEDAAAPEGGAPPAASAPAAEQEDPE